MTLLQFVSLIMDVLLVMAAGIAYLVRPRVGGQLARGQRVLLVGLMILGLAHLFETALFAISIVDLQVIELFYQSLVAIGFVFVILGLSMMQRAFYE